ncbi:MAG: lipid-A-disaccharide synthase [Bacteroidales bacterium]|nr:lipid-A-disaccharide synthase [Bacteroidales bacterium]MCF8390148.1 lipid-A-disaccharide synthase [Bacteroidales bacterium]
MKYYLIAGEASGDLHASNLMKELQNLDTNTEFRFFGGDKMLEVGGTLVRHYKEMAFMGLVDVLANLRTISKNLTFCKEDIQLWKPDAIILVDYAGFNLRIAEYAKGLGIKVYYYISPKVWVWKKSRIKKLKLFTDKLFVIFPFEVDFFKSHNMKVEYYGNPLMDSYSQFIGKAKNENDFRKENDLSEKPLIALLSGSRKDEIKRCLPEMVRAAKSFPEYQFVVAGAPSIPDDLYHKILVDTEVRLLKNSTYDILKNAYAGIITSGTATLETAIFKVPQVVVYMTSPFNFYLARMFIKVRFFSLVNLISGKEVVKELLQFKIAERVIAELQNILKDAAYRQKMLKNYNDLHTLVGEPGSSFRIAERIHELGMVNNV